MNMSNMFTGVAVAIDDEVNDSTANISNILKQIRRRGIPLLVYEKLPSTKTIPHFKNLSFLLLDWNFKDKAIKGNRSKAKLGDEIIKHNVQENIDFLYKVVKETYCPIFIFTNENVDDIQTELINAKLCVKDQPNNIFVRSKAKLKDAKLFPEVEKWMKRNPSIYVLKEWEKEYQNSRNKLFSEFQDLSPIWPKIMWKNFKEDGTNQSAALGELIFRNLHTRMSPFDFLDSVLGKQGRKIDKAELRRVLEGEKYLENLGLRSTDIGTGDIFKRTCTEEGSTKAPYYLNIRPQCDLLRSSPDDTELYCLKGRFVDESKINKKGGIAFSSGQFLEKINNAVVPFLDKGCIIEFLFKDLKVMKWKSLKADRIGRLLPPHINRIQQRYAFYLQRQALPRTPQIAICNGVIR